MHVCPCCSPMHTRARVCMRVLPVRNREREERNGDLSEVKVERDVFLFWAGPLARFFRLGLISTLSTLSSSTSLSYLLLLSSSHSSTPFKHFSRNGKRL